MKVSLEWLKEFVTIRLSPEELAHRLTMAGSEVIGIVRTGGEPVLDFEITPNRPDCLSIIGIAREIAAITGSKLKLPPVVQGSRLKVQGKQPRTSNLEPRTPLVIRIEDRKGCRRYIGRLIKGVRPGLSPSWMQQRLEACGIRPINNLVDITNYVLLEYGQPLHAFDHRKLSDGTILVRRAHANEKIAALDGNAYALSSEDLVIADATRPVAIAGVMGGQESAVNEHTTTVLLESAEFDPLSVRRTARRLGMATESSYRFERGVDPAGVETASRRAAQLIIEIAGGRETAVKDVGERIAKRTVVNLDGSRVQRWLGASPSLSMVKRTLESLGCAARAAKNGWRVTPPSFRRDLQQDVDLIEELARVTGYERIPGMLPSAVIGARRDGKKSSYQASYELRTLCVSLGLSEIMTWSLVSEGELKLSNPLSLDHVALRPTLLVGMLRAVSKNLAQDAQVIRLFELGNVFTPREALQLGIGLAGAWERSWQGRQEAGLFRLKGLVEQLVVRAYGQTPRVRPAALPWAEPGQGMELMLGDTPLGVAGQVARRIAEAWDIDKPVWFGELDAEALLAHGRPATHAQTPGVFPPVKRDISFLVEKQIAYADVEALLRATGSPLAVRVELIDRYADRPGLPPDKHSLTFSIEYRDPSRTLTAEEVNEVHRQIGHELVQQFGATLRA